MCFPALCRETCFLRNKTLDDMDVASGLTNESMEKILRERRERREAEERKIANSGVVTHRECSSCGENIDPRRLKAVPTAKLCFSCQSEME